MCTRHAYHNLLYKVQISGKTYGLPVVLARARRLIDRSVTIARMYIPYSRKIWLGIKFGGLAVYLCNRQIKMRQYFILAYIHVAIPYRTAKFKSANIFAIAIWGPTAKFNPRQYFRLYGICICTYVRIHLVHVTSHAHDLLTHAHNIKSGRGWKLNQFAHCHTSHGEVDSSLAEHHLSLSAFFRYEILHSKFLLLVLNFTCQCILTKQ